MIKFLNLINNCINKKSKKQILNKFFEIIKIIMLSQNLFDDDNSSIFILKQFEIIYKLLEIIFIENNGKIKLEKNLFELIDKYNNINNILIKINKNKKSYSNLDDNCSLISENEDCSLDLENDD